MKLLQRFRRKLFTKKSKKSGESHPSHNHHENRGGDAAETLTGISDRMKKNKMGTSLQLPPSKPPRYGLGRKQNWTFSDNYPEEDSVTVAVSHTSAGGSHTMKEDDPSVRVKEVNVMASHSRSRNNPVYVDMGGTITFRTYCRDAILPNHQRYDRNVEGKACADRVVESDPFDAFVKSRTKFLEWKTSTPTTSDNGESTDYDDIGELPPLTLPSGEHKEHFTVAGTIPELAGSQRGCLEGSQDAQSALVQTSATEPNGSTGQATMSVGDSRKEIGMGLDVAMLYGIHFDCCAQQGLLPSLDTNQEVIFVDTKWEVTSSPDFSVKLEARDPECPLLILPLVEAHAEDEDPNDHGASYPWDEEDEDLEVTTKKRFLTGPAFFESPIAYMEDFVTILDGDHYDIQYML